MSTIIFGISSCVESVRGTDTVCFASVNRLAVVLFEVQRDLYGIQFVMNWKCVTST